MSAARTAFVVCALALLSACAKDMAGPELQPPPGPDIVFRQLDCVETAADGVTCNKKRCKAAEGGPQFYCDVYAYYCVRAGHRWEGTKVLGHCTRTHPD